MRVLIDAQALIWWVDRDHLLGVEAHDAISNVDNELLVSAATIWEIAIKVGLEELLLSMPYAEWMRRALEGLGAALLPITIEYAELQLGLPKHHGDPFDRMLVAQALAEGVPVIGSDTVFEQYGVSRIW